MPRMNGADLAREAERIHPGVKILFISGHPERAARIKALMSGRKEADGSNA
jgi:DNA-binding NarL/FixJ family response regulator